MVRSKRSISLATAGVVLCLGGGYAAHAADDDQPSDGEIRRASKEPEHSGVPSGHSRAEYRTEHFESVLAAGNDDPFLLPVAMPPGQSDAVPFLVDGSPITEVDGSGRTWWSQFTADSLPPASGTATGYEVYQVSAEASAPDCAPSESVLRTVGDNNLVICLGPQPSEAARDYWATVSFSSNLNEIAWLSPGGVTK